MFMEQQSSSEEAHDAIMHSFTEHVHAEEKGGERLAHACRMHRLQNTPHHQPGRPLLTYLQSPRQRLVICFPRPRAWSFLFVLSCISVMFSSCDSCLLLSWTR